MKVVISGNGIASKVLQLLLSKQKFLSSITVLEKSPLTSHLINNESHSEYIGLWGPSVHILDWLGVWSSISHEKYVTKSSYRTADGKHIAKPYADLTQPGKGNNSLVFVERRELLEILDKALSKTDHTILHTRYDEIIMKIGRSAKGIEINTSKNQKIITDLLVAADGQNSNVRSLIYPDERFLNYRGYTVFRGHTHLDSSASINTKQQQQQQQQQVSEDTIVQDSFQSWGVGSRFACVPTQKGTAWFAAITTPPLLSSTPISSMPRHEQKQQLLWSSNDSSSDQQHLAQGNYSITAKQYDMLMNKFSSWHSPISDLLLHTKIEDITVCNAFAFETVVKTGLSGQPFHNNADFANNTYSSSQNSKRMTSSSSSSFAADVGVAFIGDAAHTLDPILAQGAGIAIEDAALLNYALLQYMKPYPQQQQQNNQKSQNNDDNSSSSNSSSSDLYMTSFKKSLEQYESDRINRVSTLHRLSNLSQYMSHINSTTTVKIRDFIFQIMNQSSFVRYINEHIFDYAIHASTNSRVFHYYK